jgi:hypothetical protein
MTLARPKPAQVAAAKREIARRYRQRKHGRTSPQLAALRLADLARLFRGRYGLTLPDSPNGRIGLEIALAHLAALSGARDRMREYVTLWTPWLTMGAARDMIDDALARPRKWRADRLAWRLRLTAADRKSLGITTIGAIDMNKAARTAARRDKSKARSQRRRLKLTAANAP